MSRPVSHLPPSHPEPPVPESRQRYEDLLVRAMRRAERLVPHEQAFEIAHDVAVELLRHPPEQITGALLQLRIISRLQNLRTAGDRRAALDRAFLESQSRSTPAWAQPGAGLEARELHARLTDVVVRMPAAMRDVFLLIREEELTYKEAARRLGIGVGTVHTQLSRASALLRECVDRYHAGEGYTPASPVARRGGQT